MCQGLVPKTPRGFHLWRWYELWKQEVADNRSSYPIWCTYLKWTFNWYQTLNRKFISKTDTKLISNTDIRLISSGCSGFLHQKTDFIIISPPWYDPGCCWGVKPLNQTKPRHQIDIKHWHQIDILDWRQVNFHSRVSIDIHMMFFIDISIWHIIDI